jgi:hypothetical protein
MMETLSPLPPECRPEIKGLRHHGGWSDPLIQSHVCIVFMSQKNKSRLIKPFPRFLGFFPRSFSLLQAVVSCRLIT